MFGDSFGWGLPSLPFSNPWSFVPSPLPAGTSQSGGQVNASAPDVPWYQVLLSSGLDGFKTWLNFDLGQQQVAKGQLPSVAPGGGTVLAGNIGGGIGTIILWVVIIVIVFAVIKALK